MLARSDGEIVDGHLRLKAARKLGIIEVPVILGDEWTPAQDKAFRLMVNRSVTWADWDEALLSQELPALKDLDYVGSSAITAACADHDSVKAQQCSRPEMELEHKLPNPGALGSPQPLTPQASRRIFNCIQRLPHGSHNIM